jgi:hypothetical protein
MEAREIRARGEHPKEPIPVAATERRESQPFMMNDPLPDSHTGHADGPRKSAPDSALPFARDQLTALVVV